MNEFALFCDSALHRIKNNIKFNNQNVHSSDEPSKKRVNKSRSIALKFRVNSRSYLCSIRIFFIVSECMTMCITLCLVPPRELACVLYNTQSLLLYTGLFLNSERTVLVFKLLINNTASSIFVNKNKNEYQKSVSSNSVLSIF